MFLDDTARLAERDVSNMLQCLFDLPEVALPAYQGAARVSLPIAEPKLVVICGMGGSAISGDLLRTLVQGTARVPVLVHRGDRLPAFVDAHCLVVVMSYSGNTAETLGCLRDAIARQVPTVVVSSGGEASALAQAHGARLLPIPAGKQPRAAVGELFFSLLGLLTPITAVTEQQVADAVQMLKALRAQLTPDSPQAVNPAKQLAVVCHGRRILIAGTTSTTEAVANRWKCQINENAKVTVQFAVFPELTHNDVVNLLDSADQTEVVIVLGDTSDSSLIKRQRDICLGLFREKGLHIEELTADGDTPLARQLGSLYLGDYVSVYMAFLRNLDPTPVEAIGKLKQRMQQVSEPVN